jgi:cleavage and polyadenylation specificity factor subunit 3
MLQSGLSRELFELWCSDKRNGVVLPGYCVEGTLAKTIMSEPEDITALNGQKLPLRVSLTLTLTPSLSLSLSLTL